jgi:polyisoprenoid-binding protein YceI
MESLLWTLKRRVLVPLTDAREGRRLSGMRTLELSALVMAVAVIAPVSWAQVPVFEINRAESSIKFNVKASVEIAGAFEKWSASVKFRSPELTSAILDIRIQAASVHTGSDVKDGKLKGKDFFDAEQSPLIRFHSTKVVQTGPETVEFVGNFTIRGVTRREKLTFTIEGKGTRSPTVTGTMAFDRKQYGMNSGIPFIKVADRVEVTIDLKGKRVSGPGVVYKQ